MRNYMAIRTKRYSLRWAKIGNSAGFRLSADFFKDHPDLLGADGTVEVLGSGKLLVTLQSEALDQWQDELMLRMFLDFVTGQALSKQIEIELYTEAMAAEDDALMEGVALDTDP